MIGIIIKALSGFYYVKTESGVVTCRGRGSLRNKKISPKVGDRVKITLEGECGAVDEVLPRKNELSRPPVANIDLLGIVVSTVAPSPNFAVIDEIIALAEIRGIEPFIAVSKTDIEEAEILKETYVKAGFKVFDAVEQFEEIKAFLGGKVCAFTGNTGVGKSTLLNRINPEFQIETGEISKKLGRGRHTTRAVEFYSVDGGGLVADTPGFSLNQDDDLPILKEDLENCFREFGKYIGSCRFGGCSHTSEKGCAVIEAVGKGDIPEVRFESYKALYSKVKDKKKWQM